MQKPQKQQRQSHLPPKFLHRSTNKRAAVVKAAPAQAKKNRAQNSRVLQLRNVTTAAPIAILAEKTVPSSRKTYFATSVTSKAIFPRCAKANPLLKEAEGEVGLKDHLKIDKTHMLLQTLPGSSFGYHPSLPKRLKFVRQVREAHM